MYHSAPYATVWHGSCILYGMSKRNRTEASVWYQDAYGFRGYGPWRGPKAEAAAREEATKLRTAHPRAAIRLYVVTIDQLGGKVCREEIIP